MAVATVEEFGKMVCDSLGIKGGVCSVVIEAYPQEALTITMEVSANSEEVRKWAQSQSIANPGRVVLIEIDDGEMK